MGYIYRERVRRAIRKVVACVTCPSHIAANIYQALDSIPDENVEPVIHSSWELIKDAPFGVCDYHFKCKRCHSDTPQNAYVVAPDYCPNCGAKMDMDGGEE